MIFALCDRFTSNIMAHAGTHIILPINDVITVLHPEAHLLLFNGIFPRDS